MAQSVQSAVVSAVRDTVPFLAIMAVWILVMLVLYGLFLVTKPGNVDYDAWVHGTVFLVPMVGFLGHTLRQALKDDC